MPEARLAQPYAGIILAAGRSSRMEGGSKLLAGFGSASVLHRVVRSARAASLDPIFVVVAGPARDIRRALQEEPVRFVTVEGGAAGRLASVLAGLGAARRASAPGVAILLGDEPGLSAAHVRAVVEAVRSGPESAGRARFRDRPGHPVVLKAEAVEKAEEVARSVASEASLWDLIVQSTLTHRGIAIADAGPIDVDTRADLDRARQREASEPTRG